MKLLILDLDETLIYASETPLAREPDFTLASYSIYRRPHLDAFLAFCFSTFTVAVWSIASPEYVREVVNNIMPLPDHLAFIWARDRCTLAFDAELQTPYYVKDLSKVKRKGYPLSTIIAVDDLPERYTRQYGNLVQVAPFNGDPADNELVYLQRYLQYLATVENIRVVEKRGWRAWVKNLVKEQ